MLGGCSGRVAVVVVPATISTVRERKGLAFPVPRPILLASLIESAPNCAAANGIPSCRFTRLPFPLSFFLLKCCEVKPVDGLSNFLFLAVIDVYSREMMRT